MAKAWTAADLVVDVTGSSGQLYFKVTTDALASGTRVLRLTAPVDILRRMFPDPEIKRKAMVAKQDSFQPVRYDVTIYGYCDKCLEENYTDSHRENTEDHGDFSL